MTFDRVSPTYLMPRDKINLSNSMVLEIFIDLIKFLNDNLPQFINMGPRYFDVRDGHYLGPAYDAVPLKVDLDNPLPYAQSESNRSRQEQQIEFDLIHRLNTLRGEAKYPDDAALQARIKSYALAFRMQTAAPLAIDLNQEIMATYRNEMRKYYYYHKGSYSTLIFCHEKAAVQS